MPYEICFTPQADADYTFWKNTDPKKVKKIDALLDSCEQNPYQGIGKPEQLKHHMSGCWSRRIDKTHRLVYIIQGNKVIISQCRYHY